MIVVADTSPINYLIQLTIIDVLSELYSSVLLPMAVVAELRSADAPSSVRGWAEQPPTWCKLAVPRIEAPSELAGLDPGETEALQLALELKADLVLVDDLEARSVAARLSLTTRGTLGVLHDAHYAGLLHAPRELERLTTMTNFYLAKDVRADFLEIFRAKQ